MAALIIAVGDSDDGCDDDAGDGSGCRGDDDCGAGVN